MSDSCIGLTLSIPNCVSAASGETVYSVSAEAQATEGKAEAGGEAAQGSEVAELFGKPWIDKICRNEEPLHFKCDGSFFISSLALPFLAIKIALAVASAPLIPCG